MKFSVIVQYVGYFVRVASNVKAVEKNGGCTNGIIEKKEFQIAFDNYGYQNSLIVDSRNARDRAIFPDIDSPN